MKKSKKYYAVITDNDEKANNIFSEIESTYCSFLNKSVLSENGRFSEFSNGIIMRHLRPECVEGFRFDRLWIDRSVDEEYFLKVILQEYVGDLSDIIWI